MVLFSLKCKGIAALVVDSTISKGSGKPRMYRSTITMVMLLVEAVIQWPCAIIELKEMVDNSTFLLDHRWQLCFE